MPITTMPAIDADVCSGWTENDLDAYNSMSFYLAKMQVERRETWGTFSKFTQKRKWKANNGPLLRGVRTAPSPHMRQFAMPSVMRNLPKKDVMNVREVKADADVRRHRFESQNLNFWPSFNDFMDHVDETGKDIMEKIERYEDLFLRTAIWHMSPYVFVCKANGDIDVLTSSDGVPIWSGVGDFTDGTDGKTAAWLQATLPQVTGNLSLTGLNKAFTIFETDFRVPAFSGKLMPSGQDNGLDGLYAVTTSSEAYNQFTFDPWLKDNKNCDFDIVNKSFRGKIFGRLTCGLEDMVMRCTTAGVFHAPELRVATDDAYNSGDTEPNPSYTDIGTSPVEIGFLAGGFGYESIEVGPPPSQFTGDSPPHNFPGMWWNGEVKLTKQFLLECIDPDTGAVRYEQNTYGEWLRFVSQAAFGILAKNRRYMAPIIYLRKRGQ